MQPPGGGTLDERIRSRYRQLTPRQRVLAEHVLSNSEQVAFMSSQELARAAHVSEAAVVRFAQAMGYRGYPELRSYLRGQVLDRLGASQLQRRSSPVLQVGPGLAHAAFDMDREILAATERANPWPQFAAVIDLLCGAQRIFVAGHGTAHGAADYLNITLNQALGISQLLAVGGGDMFDRLSTLDSGDVLVGISLTRYLRWTAQALEVAGRRQAATVLITDASASPIAGLAGHVLIAPTNSLSFTWSQVGIFGIINVLLAGIARCASERTAARLAEMDQLLAEYDLLYHDVARPMPPAAGSVQSNALHQIAEETGSPWKSTTGPPE
ncbi:MAG: MurR/RpiR family transcriptional regulator [Chloroflexota bacterium]|nr:MurR/RpiR family transcriptional regulator [Chloroflexota bacterium]